MKMRYTGSFLLALLLSLLPAAALAQEMVFHLDPAQSSVEFTLGDVLHTVHGTFQLQESTLHIDPSSGKASGAILVNAASGNTGTEARDHKMHKEVLESVKYPQIRFTVQSMQGALPSNGSSEVKLSGVINVHGGDHPLTVSVPVQVANGQAKADVHFVVPYVQWGMKDPSTFVLRVSKDVDIVVHAVGSLTSAPKP